jgi:hypothetical protein
MVHVYIISSVVAGKRYSEAIRKFACGRAKLPLSQAARTNSLSGFVAARLRLGGSLALPFSDSPHEIEKIVSVVVSHQFP